MIFHVLPKKNFRDTIKNQVLSIIWSLIDHYAQNYIFYPMPHIARVSKINLKLGIHSHGNNDLTRAKTI